MKNICKNCKYFDACGDPERTTPCKGRSVARKNKYYHMIEDKLNNKIKEFEKELKEVKSNGKDLLL